MAPNAPAPAPRETVTSIVGEYIVSTPSTCDGEPRVAGTRIKVRHVYTWVERQGLTVAEVVANYPPLSRSAVHAALAYYWARPDEIHAAIAAEERFVAELKAKAGPSFVVQKRAAGG